MRTYVLGAGASLHAGYPLAHDFGTRLLNWMRLQTGSDFPTTADWLDEEFGPITNIEDLFSEIQTLILEFQAGTKDQRLARALLASKRGNLVQAVRAWFSEIRDSEATAYRDFARHVVQPGDCVVTFNYDVSLDRELVRNGKWNVGDGYGFTMQGLPGNSQTRLLKLHGSAIWLALLFGGATGFFQFHGDALGTRPVIGTDDLSYLGYAGLSDPSFQRASGGVLPMIMPTLSKEFFFDTSFGREWEDFWNGLWQQARRSLNEAEEVVLLGYSLAAADERASELLLSAPTHSARIEISSGSDTGRIAEQFRSAGYRIVVEAKETHFESWMQSRLGNITA